MFRLDTAACPLSRLDRSAPGPRTRRIPLSIPVRSR